MKMHTQGECHMNTGVTLPPDKKLPELGERPGPDLSLAL